MWVIHLTAKGSPVWYHTNIDAPDGCAAAAGTLSNGLCEAANNNAVCLYDGGDCCPSTCLSAQHTCGSGGGYACKIVEGLMPVPSREPTQAPTTAATQLLPTPPPTAVPSYVPGSTTTLAPTAATVAVVSVSQTITGVAPNDAVSAAFAAAVQQSAAYALGVPVGAVSLPTVVYSPSRWRVRARALLTAGATASYTVSAANALPAAVISAVSSSGAAMTTALKANGYPGASVTAVNAVNLSPTAAPSSAPSDPPPSPSPSAVPAVPPPAAATFSVGAVAGGVVGGAAAGAALVAAIIYGGPLARRLLDSRSADVATVSVAPAPARM